MQKRTGLKKSLFYSAIKGIRTSYSDMWISECIEIHLFYIGLKFQSQNQQNWLIWGYLLLNQSLLLCLFQHNTVQTFVSDFIHLHTNGVVVLYISKYRSSSWHIHQYHKHTQYNQAVTKKKQPTFNFFCFLATNFNSDPSSASFNHHSETLGVDCKTNK